MKKTAYNYALPKASNAQEAWTARYNHETIAMGFSVTEEAMEDNLYDSLPSGDRYEHTSALPDSDRVSVVSQILSVSGPFEGEYGPSWTVVGRAEQGWNWITQTTSRPFVDAAYEARSRREAIGMVGAVKRIEDDRRKPDAKIVRLTRCKTH